LKYVVWPETGATDGCGEFIVLGMYRKPTDYQLALWKKLSVSVEQSVAKLKRLGVEGGGQ
jgi:hypothetical protein